MGPMTCKTSAAAAYTAALDHLDEAVPDVAQCIRKELKDQREYLKLIASENYSSLTVQLTMGNLLTDKYSEGYSHHRFYAGCGNVDAVEDIASEELKRIFGCDHAYVQPHSGADANLIAFWAILTHKIQNAVGKKIEEMSAEEYETMRQKMCQQKVLGMSLNAGGHLTHGYRHNVSAKMFQALSYDIDPKTEMIDYEALMKQAVDEKPLILIAGYSAYPKAVNFVKMREIADASGAVLMVDMAHFAGLVAGKVFTGEYDPIPYADIVTSTTHKTMRGPRGGMILCTDEYRDVVNKGCPMVMGGPLPHVMAAKAVAFKEANTPEFQAYAEQIVKNAQALAEQLKKRGATLYGGGTENHLLVMNVTKTFGLTGRQAELLLRKGHITVNRNTVPFDTNGAWYTSGVRIGTPALTTRGLKEEEMRQIADLIYDLLSGAKPKEGSLAKTEIDESLLTRVKHDVLTLLEAFPLYPEV